MADANSNRPRNGFKDETGKVYGKLTVLHEVHNDKPGAYWRVRCECGHEFDIFSGNLRQSFTTREKSCRKCRNITHGLSDTPEHCVWKSMRRRCFSSRNQDYGHYGGRGITICERWSKFENFLADMGKKPFPRAEVGRIDNDGPYSPDNARWETRSQQTRNTRRNHMLTFRGRTQCLAAWAEEVGLTLSALKHRIYRGWNVEKALTTTLRG
jgi:hypothetical protein